MSARRSLSRTIRIVDGTIVREPGKTGSQWRILYCIRLPSLVCDFFEVTATIGEGSGESLNRLPVGPHELILADAGYCSVAGIEYVLQQGADVLVRVNPQSFVAYSAYGRRICLLSRLRNLSEVGQFGEWRVVLHGQGSWFKRLKSLAQLGHVPKHDDRSSRAWLYRKLLVTLLAQKLIRIGRDISPSGYSLSARGTM